MIYHLGNGRELNDDWAYKKIELPENDLKVPFWKFNKEVKNALIVTK